MTRTPATRILVQADRVRLPLAAPVVRRIALGVLRGERRRGRVAITFLGPTRMRALNRAWKGHDRPTDVLAFTLREPGGGLTGDVYICPSVARVQARAWGVPAGEEIRRLVIHGILHLLGHDHPEGEGRERSPMWRRQERYVKALA